MYNISRNLVVGSENSGFSRLRRPLSPPFAACASEVGVRARIPEKIVVQLCFKINTFRLKYSICNRLYTYSNYQNLRLSLAHFLVFLFALKIKEPGSYNS